MDKRPIGIFDSGVGGLTVLKQICKLLPYEDIIYFGDTARVPYGSKSKQTIIKFAFQNSKFLISKNVKLIIVACNSASSNAIVQLRNSFSLPFIDVIEPTVKKIINLANIKKIAVIGTYATIQSKIYSKKFKNFDIKIKEKSCPLFVPLVEEGMLNHPITFQITKEYLSELKKFRPNVVILGCTHYPLLKNVISKIMGDSIILIDSAEETAKKVKEFVISNNISNLKNKKGKIDFFVSDLPRNFKKIAKVFLTNKIPKVKIIDIETFCI